MTATATIRAEVREGNDWLRRRFATLVERLNNVVHGSHPSAGCVPRIGDEGGANASTHGTSHLCVPRTWCLKG
jgi:hypothetical protein